MDNKSATNAEAAPCVIKNTTSTLKDDLENLKKDMTTEKKLSNAMEILEGFGVRLYKIEEKMDLLISLIRSNNEVKIAEAENMSVDGSSFYEEPYKKMIRYGPFVGGRGDDPFFDGRGVGLGGDPFVGGRDVGPFDGYRGGDPFVGGRGGDPFVGGRGGDPFDGNRGGEPFVGGFGRGRGRGPQNLFVGGRFGGGRCGGQGHCAAC